MTLRISALHSLLERAVEEVCPALQLVVRWREEEIVNYAGGWLDPETQQSPTRNNTRFDLASISKLFVATAFMQLVEMDIVSLNQPVATILPNFQGLRPIQPYEAPLEPGGTITVSDDPGPVDAGKVTFRHLLTHTSGLPAWRPLFRQANPQAARRMAVETFFSYPTGTRVIYSDIGLILLGMAVERITGQQIDQVICERISMPLGLRYTHFLPVSSQQMQLPLTHPQSTTVNVAPTEYCTWRNRRVCGEVHDENAWFLGGVAGHAGLFSTAEEVARFGERFLLLSPPAARSQLSPTSPAVPLLQPATIVEMTHLQAQDGDIRRGLGFSLWSPDPEASGNPLSQRAFGHLGFTGTMLWLDPERDLVISLLTNNVYRGRADRTIQPLRVAINQAIVEWVDQQ